MADKLVKGGEIQPIEEEEEKFQIEVQSIPKYTLDNNEEENDRRDASIKKKLANPEGYLEEFPKTRDTADVMVFRSGTNAGQTQFVNGQAEGDKSNPQRTLQKSNPIQVNKEKNMADGKGCSKEKCNIF